MLPRRIFLYAIVAVFLYFSVIVLIVEYLHHGSNNNILNGRNYLMGNLALRPYLSLHMCKVWHWKVPPSSRAVALVSFPGSGNTWFRYLLQQATGIYTGSIYMDNSLRMNGFPGEKVTNGSVLVVKTHEGPPMDSEVFSAAILLIRDPRDAFLADFNRLHNGHIGSAPKSAFTMKYKNSHTDWVTYVTTKLSAWETLHREWLTLFHGDLLLLRYESLVQNTAGVILQAVAFLNQTITESDLNCTIRHREGIYRRKQKQTFDPFTEEMYQEIAVVKQRIDQLIDDYHLRPSISTDTSF